MAPTHYSGFDRTPLSGFDRTTTEFKPEEGLKNSPWTLIRVPS